MCRSVSAETLRNVIRHAGYSSRVARKKPFISLQNQKKCLEFAKTHQPGHCHDFALFSSFCPFLCADCDCLIRKSISHTNDAALFKFR
ncbi:hypothetical protein X975_20119, partial [Stegodyphus mimosarum]